jgi:hypothetical protein
MSDPNKNVYHMSTEPIKTFTGTVCDCSVYEAYDAEKDEYFILGKLHLANMKGKHLKNVKGLISSGRFRLHRPITVGV